MKTFIASFLALVLATSVSAQCFGVYPQGTVDSGLPARCSAIPNTLTGPWVTPASALLATSGTVRIYWSEVPFNAQSDPFAAAFVAFDLGPLPGAATLPGGCVSGYVAPNVLCLPVTVASINGCQTANVLSFPPVPFLAGLQLWGQGYMLDTASGMFASSNAFVVTLQ